MKAQIIKFSLFTIVMAFGLILASCDDPQGPNNLENELRVAEDIETYNSHGNISSIVAEGIYRMPYIDGTSIFVMNDHHNHNNRYDMLAGEGTPIVAAASGWIRAIVDHHGNSPNPGDGVDINGNPHDDNKEHSCMNLPEHERPAGGCYVYNNYVWIEHPNGEWTAYVHFGTGTVSIDYGWEVGDWIESGQAIGLEGDVGFAALSDGSVPIPAFHLHFEAVRPNNPNVPLMWDQNGGGPQNHSRILPKICNIYDEEVILWDERFMFIRGETYIADSCEDNLPPVADAGGPYTVDEGSSLQLNGTGSFDPEGLPLTYRWEPESGTEDPWFLDDNTLGEPTFNAIDNAVVELTLTVYDRVEALASDPHSTTIIINNVAPTVDAGPDMSITSGEEFTFTGAFSDPGILDNPWSYEIDWGDGSTPTQGSKDDQAAPIIESHQFCAAGPHTISLFVTDKDGDTGMDDASLEVDFLAVDMEIKPGGGPSPVNLRSGGVLPVVVYSSADFDASSIDPATVTLGDEAGTDTPVAMRPNGTYMAEVKDVNGDGLPDLELKFRVPDLVDNGDLTNTTTNLVLRGFLGDACTNFRSEDEITIKP